jgi:hypothetical protein
VSLFLFWIELDEEKIVVICSICFKPYTTTCGTSLIVFSQISSSHSGCRGLTQASLAQTFLFLPWEGKVTNLGQMDSKCPVSVTMGWMYVVHG